MTASTMEEPRPASWHDWTGVIRAGLLGALLGIYLCLVGIVPTFDERPLVNGVISLGQAALVLTVLACSYVAATRAPGGRAHIVAGGAIGGLLSGGALSLLAALGEGTDLRSFLLHASPDLYKVLTLDMGAGGVWVPAVMGTLLGLIAGVTALLPKLARRSLMLGLAGMVVMGLFSGLLRTPMLGGPLSWVARQLFAPDGLTLLGAALAIILPVGAYLVTQTAHLGQRVRDLSPGARQTARVPLSVLLLLLVLVMPLGLGPFFAQVVALIALYVLMGLGLNITLGLAGLLDLGFVAFFAVGAYTVGLLTSTAEYGIAQWPFWAAVPVAVLVAMAFGVVLGLPLLGMRGDYLAIATLGFGEIIRLLVGSDLLKPLLGGPRGIVNIPKPIEVGPGHLLAGPNQIYYIALICAAVIAFVAWRLRGSRLGRAWLAIREDEDVAEALGVNLVQTKTLAYMLGAAFAGLGGAVFVALVGSIFSSSIQLYVSINVVALIIVGGMGSIPGVIVGAIVLIGLPELFREFSEYRFLFYGVSLILVMRFRPEGLIPSRIGRQELHRHPAEADPLAAEATAAS